MAKVRGAVVVDSDKCKGCGICVDACKLNVLKLAQNVNLKGYNPAYMAEPENCTGCTNCATVCPDAVITVYRCKVEE